MQAAGGAANHATEATDTHAGAEGRNREDHHEGDERANGTQEEQGAGRGGYPKDPSEVDPSNVGENKAAINWLKLPI